MEKIFNWLAAISTIIAVTIALAKAVAYGGEARELPADFNYPPTMFMLDVACDDVEALHARLDTWDPDLDFYELIPVFGCHHFTDPEMGLFEPYHYYIDDYGDITLVGTIDVTGRELMWTFEYLGSIGDGV